MVELIHPQPKTKKKDEKKNTTITLALLSILQMKKSVHVA